MTSALATVADVAKCLGRPLSGTEEEGRAETLLLLASAAFETEAGYLFSPGTYNVGRRVHKGKVKLPAVVDSVTSVTSVDQTDGSTDVLSGYTLHRNTLYGLDGVVVDRPVRNPYPLFVEVVFVVAEETPIPALIVNLVANCVARTLAGPPVGASSETAGPFSVSYVNSSGDVYISKSDRLILSRYKQPENAIIMSDGTY